MLLVKLLHKSIFTIRINASIKRDSLILLSIDLKKAIIFGSLIIIDFGTLQIVLLCAGLKSGPSSSNSPTVFLY